MNFFNTMCNRRSVLTHNGGIVNAKYPDPEFKVGEKIIVKPEEIKKLVAIMRKLACGISKMIP